MAPSTTPAPPPPPISLVFLWTWTHFPFSLQFFWSVRCASGAVRSTCCAAPQVPQEYFSLWHLHYATPHRPPNVCVCVCLSQPLWHLPLGSLINLLAPFLPAAQPDRRQRKFPSQSSFFFFSYFFLFSIFIFLLCCSLDKAWMNFLFMHFSAQ